MPLQLMFVGSVSLVGTTLLHPLGTIRVEGNKIYRYTKAGGTIAAGAAVSMSASGTVLLFAASMKACGLNATGVELTVGQYFWRQVAGEVGGLVTTGLTVGQAVGITNADGVTIAAPTTGITALANSALVVISDTAGVILLSGLY